MGFIYKIRDKLLSTGIPVPLLSSLMILFGLFLLFRDYSYEVRFVQCLLGLFL